MLVVVIALVPVLVIIAGCFYVFHYIPSQGKTSNSDTQMTPWERGASYDQHGEWDRAKTISTYNVEAGEIYFNKEEEDEDMELYGPHTSAATDVDGGGAMPDDAFGADADGKTYEGVQGGDVEDLYEVEEYGATDEPFYSDEPFKGEQETAGIRDTDVQHDPYDTQDDAFENTSDAMQNNEQLKNQDQLYFNYDDDESYNMQDGASNLTPHSGPASFEPFSNEQGLEKRIPFEMQPMKRDPDAGDDSDSLEVYDVKRDSSYQYELDNKRSPRKGSNEDEYDAAAQIDKRGPADIFI